MVHRLTSFSVGQTAKVVALLYALMALILVPFLIVLSMASPEKDRLGIGFALLLPVIYGVVGFIVTAIGCAMYNWLAQKVGGIEITVD